MELVNCIHCGWPTKADPYKPRPARLIRCNRCKEIFDPFPESPKTNEPEFQDLEKLKNKKGI